MNLEMLENRFVPDWSVCKLLRAEQEKTRHLAAANSDCSSKGFPQVFVGMRQLLALALALGPSFGRDED